jgi:dTDP-4-dehydrorhamnose 3,5-epimerase
VVAPAEGPALVNLAELSIPGLFVLESPVWSDDRGFFREWFKLGDFETQGLDFHARQANLSMSKRNVVRGLHYSLAPEGQAKVVACVFGELDDVIVDVRVGSPTFGRHEVVHLAANDVRSLLTSEVAALSYLLASPFNAEAEFEIDPFDPQINVAWSLTGEAVVSQKDANAPTLAQRQASNELPLFE